MLAEVSIDRLAGDWHIHQLARGHRFSTDDLLTAWRAASVAGDATRLLDLGAGIGSVGLMTLWRLKENNPALQRHLTMVEAQEVSHQLAKRTIVLNRLEAEITPRFGDLRDPDSVPENGWFELITGSPPYVPIGKGTMSPHPQKAACRMELRGNIYDYAKTAARALAPNGVFVCCFAGQDPRAEDAIAASGLHLRWRTQVFFREIIPATICLMVARHEPGPVVRDQLTIRDRTGNWTSEYLEIRGQMGTKLQPAG